MTHEPSAHAGRYRPQSGVSLSIVLLVLRDKPGINDMTCRRGYLRALRDRGIADHYFAGSHLMREQAAAAASDLLRRHPCVTALFCCTDETAIGVMQAAPSLSRRIPDELSIVGFDDIDPAAHVAPALTTMSVDKVSMGRLAVQLLAQRVEFPDASCVTAVLRLTLVERQSVRSIGVN